ncbi:radical SAM family heme chaperone HemW [Iamia sp. SCSIO 61187]|uniref:radical SAM family heme chaperone HemW n=1 Tax=Iamia sp. SCSIO 61187 TaxID=2722752 RepID=UPI001C634CC7|nr:radical SAM family heme chaperone HemW [Iamia sp. SCSIO 61187]QYG93699.1 radical SAM family heme chaperone HemW [Iamia sp. SCSIO 61187]
MPFCRHQCDYCAFATWTDRDHLIEQYMGACRAHAERLAPGLASVGTVFVGGGTPSRVAPDLLLAVPAALPVAADAEVTVECNPEDLDEARAHAYAAGGVTRISLGVQSLVPHVLAALGRQHPREAVAPAVAAARSAGLDVNLDVIYGGAGESVADWTTTVEGVLALEPDHVSAYALTVEGGTPLARDRARHPADDDQADKYEVVARRLEAAGFEWYEISNWARPGHRCRHNLLYWSMGEYVAIGCAAHGHRDGVRSWTYPKIESYVRAVEEGRDPVAGSERLDPDQRVLEGLQLSLRTEAGVPAAALAPDDRAVVADLVEDDGDRLVLTRAGRLLANEVAMRLRVPL